MKNNAYIHRAPKDANHPYTIISAKIINDLDGYERVIMLELLTNPDSYIIYKDAIRKRLGFPHKKFSDAWARLVSKGYIRMKRFFGGVEWIIHEDPYTNPTH